MIYCACHLAAHLILTLLRKLSKIKVGTQAAGRIPLHVKPRSASLRDPCQLSTAMGCAAAAAGSCTPFCSVCVCPAACAASTGTSTSMLDVPGPASSPTAHGQLFGRFEHLGDQGLLCLLQLLWESKPGRGHHCDASCRPIHGRRGSFACAFSDLAVLTQRQSVKGPHRLQWGDFVARTLPKAWAQARAQGRASGPAFGRLAGTSPYPWHLQRPPPSCSAASALALPYCWAPPALHPFISAGAMTVSYNSSHGSPLQRCYTASWPDLWAPPTQYTGAHQYLQGCSNAQPMHKDAHGWCAPQQVLQSHEWSAGTQHSQLCEVESHARS